MGFLLGIRLFFELVFIFAEVHHPAYRRIGIGGDFDEVYAPFLGHRERLSYGYYPELLAGFVD